MKKIHEEFLHHIWKFRLFETEYLYFNKKKVKIIDPGIHNDNSGPDFFNARIYVEGTLWAGNVEVHVRASDWLRHGHQHDPAYDSVILHVVYDDDLEIYRQSGEIIPQVRLNFSPALLDEYEKLTMKKTNPSCIGHIPGLDSLFFRDWLGKMMISRLTEKTGLLSGILKTGNNDWEDVLYRSFAMAFGFKLNAEPFRLLASSVPLSFVMKNRQKPLTLNAAFFGQAGFLDELLTDDPYYQMLQREYRPLSGLLPSPLPGKHIWKFSRSRPAGFPTNRIPQFIHFIAHQFPLFQELIKIEKLKDLRDLLKTSTSRHWVDHYLYGKPGRRQVTMLSTETIDVLIINAVIPFLFLYGKERKKDEMIQRTIEFLEELPAENNGIIKKWNKFGIQVHNAFDSQAVIQLETRYCKKRRCLKCSLGYSILNRINEKR